MYRDGMIAVVVPELNEELLIMNVLNGIPDYVDKIIVIDDGSTDKSTELIINRVKADPRVVPIIHERNMGVGKSIIDGYKKAIELGCDYAVVMAGDDQMDARYIPSLLDPIVEGNADYTKGNRLIDGKHIKGMSFWRYAGNETLTLLTKFSSGYWSVGDPQNGYTAISLKVFNSFKPDSIFPWYGYCNDILMRLRVHGFKVLDVPIPARYGTEKSKIQYPKYIARISRLLLVNFILRLAMKKMVQRSKMPSNATVAGSVFFAGGLINLSLNQSMYANDSVQVTSPNGLLFLLPLFGAIFLFYGLIIHWTGKSLKAMDKNC